MDLPFEALVTLNLTSKVEHRKMGTSSCHQYIRLDFGHEGSAQVVFSRIDNFRK